MYKETLQEPTGTGDPSNKELPASNGAGDTWDASIHRVQDVSKINRVCNAFLEALTGRQDTNLQNVVTAHVCRSPPDLDAGLSLVAKLRGKLPSVASLLIRTKRLHRGGHEPSRESRGTHLLPSGRQPTV